MVNTIDFNEGYFENIVDALEKAGYAIPDVIGPTLCIYPKDMLEIKFLPLDADDPGYPFIGIPHPNILSANPDTNNELGHEVSPAQCAWIDFEKNQVGFDYGEMDKKYPLIAEHHRRIREIVSLAISSDNSD